MVPCVNRNLHLSMQKLNNCCFDLWAVWKLICKWAAQKLLWTKTLTCNCRFMKLRFSEKCFHGGIKTWDGWLDAQASCSHCISLATHAIHFYCILFYPLCFLYCLRSDSFPVLQLFFMFITRTPIHGKHIHMFDQQGELLISLLIDFPIILLTGRIIRIQYPA